MIIDSRYLVSEIIGSGLLGTVYKAHDARTNELCQIKVFDHLNTQTFYEQFSAEEMHKITKLEHPNLVTVLSFGFDKHIYCVSEYFPSLSLQNYVFNTNRISMLYDIIVQILYALNALHSQKLYHEDLKPGNILYQINNNRIIVKLIDYGFNRIDTKQSQSTVSDILPFVAPELLAKKNPTPQSDFYSLGIILYKLITNNFPFSFDQFSTMINENQNAFYPKFIREFNPEIPLQLESFIMKLVEKKPEDRFHNTEEAIMFLNKAQPKIYPYSHSISLLQAIKFNSYIVRESITHLLTEYVQDLHANFGRIVTLVGDDGMGKESLLTLFKYHFLTDNYFILDYTCSENNKDPIFALIKEFLSALSKDRKEKELYASIILAHEYSVSPQFDSDASDKTDLSTSTNSQTNASLDSLFLTCQQFIHDLVNIKPVILIIRAAEYITDATLQFLNYLSETIAGKPMMIIVSSFDHNRIKGIIHSTHLRVSSLSLGETKEYSQNILNITPDEKFVWNIHYRSSGNPYFIREILADLIQKKILLHHNQINFDFSFDDYALPNHLLQIVLQRFNKISEQTYNTLRYISIINTPITKHLIKHLLDIPDHVFFHFHQEAINNEILHEQNFIYNFTFPECKNKLLNECSIEEKQTISQKLLLYFANFQEYDINICKGLIHNATICGDLLARKKYSTLLVGLYSSQRNQKEAFQVMVDIIQLIVDESFPIEHSEIVKDLALLIEKADLTGCINEAIMLMLNIRQFPQQLFEWYYTLAQLFFLSKNYLQVDVYLGLAFPLAQEENQIIKLLLLQAATFTGLNNLPEAKKCFEQLENYQLAKDEKIILVDYFGLYLVAAGRYSEAVQCYEATLAKLENSSQLITPTHLTALYFNLGLIYSKYDLIENASNAFLINVHQEAEKLFILALQIAEKIKYDRLTELIHIEIGDLALKQGNTSLALEYFQKAVNLSIILNNKPGLIMAYISFGEAHIKLGKYIEAESYLNNAHELTDEHSTIATKTQIDHNFALCKNKIYNFSYFYNFFQQNYSHLDLHEVKNYSPIIKSYLLFRIEIGDLDTLKKYIYQRLNHTEKYKDDFYYQVVAHIACGNKDYPLAIKNYNIALESATKINSSYAISIIDVNLAICYYHYNDLNKAEEYLLQARTLILKNNYYYWRLVLEITQLKIYLLKKDIHLRYILRETLALLPEIIKNSYFLLEIELYSILVQLYIELKSLKLANKYYIRYTEKVFDAVRGLPEVDQQLFFKIKKINLKSINECNFFQVTNRMKYKLTHWNFVILELLRLEDTERIKYHLNTKIDHLFAPYAYAIIIFNKHDTLLKPYLNSSFTIYTQKNFHLQILRDNNLIQQITKAIENNKQVLTIINSQNTIIMPLALKDSLIGLWILQDNSEMPFNKYEQKIIKEFSFYLSTMLIRSSEYEEIKQNFHLMQKLVEVTNYIKQTNNLDELENFFVQNIIDITQAKRGFFVKKDKLGHYYFSITLDQNHRNLEQTSGFSVTTVSQVLQDRAPLYIKHETNYDYRNRQQILDYQTNEIYCAPLFVAGQVYGVLYLDTWMPQNQLNSKSSPSLVINKMILEMFLAQINLALQNAVNYQTLLKKNLELQTIDSMKNDFIAVVSSELNNPLISLQDRIQIIKQNIPSTDQDTSILVSKLETSTEKLVSHINNIATLFRYQQKSDLFTKPTDLSELLEDIHKIIIERSKVRKMKIKLEVEANLPLANIDPEAIRILLFALLVNAVRFTPNYGNILFGARKAIYQYEKIDNQESFILYVQDNGIGIPQLELSNIFKPFYRIGDLLVHNSEFLEFRSGGLGIGLAVVQRITELHHGLVRVKSTEKEGSAFIISLPINEP